MTRKRPELVSVIMAAFNAASTIGQQLGSLADQDYQGPFEVIVADNGSTDGTVEVAEAFADRLDLRVVDARGSRGSGPARNFGVAASRGDLLAFADADDIAGLGWLNHLVAAARDFDLVSGPYELEKLNSTDVLTWRRHQPMDRLPVFLHFLPFVQGGNFAMWSDVRRSLGDFCDGPTDDIDMSWRAQLAGYRIGFSTGAVMHHRFRATLRGFGRQQFKRGERNCGIYRNYRDHGVRRPSQARSIRKLGKCILQIPLVIVSPARRGVWTGEFMYRVGRVRGSIRYRVLFL